MGEHITSVANVRGPASMVADGLSKIRERYSDAVGFVRERFSEDAGFGEVGDLNSAQAKRPVIEGAYVMVAEDMGIDIARLKAVKAANQARGAGDKPAPTN